MVDFYKQIETVVKNEVWVHGFMPGLNLSASCNDYEIEEYACEMINFLWDEVERMAENCQFRAIVLDVLRENRETFYDNAITTLSCRENMDTEKLRENSDSWL